MRYSIFDPTGNITALVETDVPVQEQPAVAAFVQARHPVAEQVGFVRFNPADNNDVPSDSIPVQLRMAGGEFCGNATMSAAAWYLMREAPLSKDESRAVKVAVDGVEHPLTVVLTADAAKEYDACLAFPCAMTVGREELLYEKDRKEVLCVQMEGITHLIPDDQDGLYELKNDPEKAAAAVRYFCDQLHCEALGIMFLEKDRDGRKDSYQLTPLVYVPRSNTLFWEHSCASGTAACGYAIANERGDAAELVFTEPGGVMRISFDPSGGELLLHGHTRLVSELR